MQKFPGLTRVGRQPQKSQRQQVHTCLGGQPAAAASFPSLAPARLAMVDVVAAAGAAGSALAVAAQDVCDDEPSAVGCEVTIVSDAATVVRSPGEPAATKAVATATSIIFNVSMCSSVWRY
jgi:hypothetical protein